MATAEMTVVDADGDLTLVCGESDNVKRIRVSSSMLVIHSKVFKTMLGPRFKEGQTLQISGSLELPLPDDDGQAWEVICRVLYNHHDEISVLSNGYLLNDEAILAVATLVDKYDCARPFKPYARMWIEKALKMASFQALRKLLTASFYFHDARLFQQTSEKLILTSTKYDWNLPAEKTEENWPEIIHKVLALLKCKNQELLQAAASAIEKVLEMRLDTKDCKDTFTARCAKGCKYLEESFCQLTQHLKARDLWPVTKIEKDAGPYILQRMKVLNLGKEKAKFCAGRKSDTDVCKGATVESFAECTKFIHTFVWGEEHFGEHVACYECAREGKAALVQGPCMHDLLAAEWRSGTWVEEGF